MMYSAAIVAGGRMAEAAALLIPGAHMAVFSSEESVALKARSLGFTLRDTMLVYSPGRAETAFLFRKSLGATTVAENSMMYGVGGINVEKCRVSWGNETPSQEEWNRLGSGGDGNSTTAFLQHTAIRKYYEAGLIPVPTGRWPTNLVVIHDTTCQRMTDLMWQCSWECHVPAIDEQSGFSSSAPRPRHNKVAGMFPLKPQDSQTFGYDDKGGGSRFFPQFASRIEMLAWIEKLLAPEGTEVFR
jgi:hypothetical protein